MKTYTKEEMLALWREQLGFDPCRTDCALIADDGVDVDREITRRMRAWYLNLLDTADPRLLPVSEMGRASAVEADGCAWRAVIKPPVTCRRVLAVKLQGWDHEVAPMAWSEAAEALARLANPYCRPTAGTPLALLRPDGSIVAAPVTLPVVETLRGIADPGEDSYTLDEKLLTLNS